MNACELAKAYERFILLRHSETAEGPEIMGLESYDFCDEIRHGALKVPMVAAQVSSDLRELINAQNRWSNELRKWRTWIQILPEFNQEEQWDLRLELVDGIARACMLEPSAMRDRMLRAIHFALHHVNLTLIPNYKDELREDTNALKKLSSNNPPRGNRHRPRTDWTDEVNNLAQHWPNAMAFLKTLKKLDSDLYREKSMDYRNASSHSIAPHFEFGIVPYVTRNLQFARKPIDTSDGFVEFVPDTTKVVISYGFGEKGPLKLADAFSDNRAQLAIMRNAITQYEAFLRDVFQQLAGPQ